MSGLLLRSTASKMVMQSLHTGRGTIALLVGVRPTMDKTIHSGEYQCFLRELRRARETAGLTQSEVADRLNEPQSWISRVESGETRMHVIEFRAYCLAIGLNPREFMATLESALRSLSGSS